MCRRITGNDDDGADAAQDALIAIARGIARFDGQSRFSTWAYRVAVNTSLDELRRRKRRPVPTDLEAPEAPEVAARSTDETAGLAQRLDIDAALLRLAPEFRAAVVLRDLCGLDYAEIAEVLDIPPGTVRSRIARGRGALADDLAGNPSTDPVRPRPEP